MNLFKLNNQKLIVFYRLLFLLTTYVLLSGFFLSFLSCDRSCGELTLSSRAGMILTAPAVFLIYTTFLPVSNNIAQKEGPSVADMLIESGLQNPQDLHLKPEMAVPISSPSIFSFILGGISLFIVLCIISYLITVVSKLLYNNSTLYTTSLLLSIFLI